VSNHQKRKKEGNNQEEITPLNISVEKKVENSTSYKTVGSVRKSKNGNAISIKLFPENRYLHISIKDVERILTDTNNETVGNVREYERRN
jgi:hypothetical protein